MKLNKLLKYSEAETFLLSTLVRNYLFLVKKEKKDKAIEIAFNLGLFQNKLPIFIQLVKMVASDEKLLHEQLVEYTTIKDFLINNLPDLIEFLDKEYVAYLNKIEEDKLDDLLNIFRENGEKHSLDYTENELKEFDLIIF